MVFYKNDFLQSYRVGDNIYVARADRQPCLVCGHPTGDCVGDAEKPDHIAGLGGNMLESAQTYLVEEDIFVERQLTPTVTTKILVHPKGKIISVTEAKKFGLI
jgi:hypothetical protein